MKREKSFAKFSWNVPAKVLKAGALQEKFRNECRKTKFKTYLRSFWLRGRLETANFKVPNFQTASRSARLGVLSGWALSGA